MRRTVLALAGLAGAGALIAAWLWRGTPPAEPEAGPPAHAPLWTVPGGAAQPLPAAGPAPAAARSSAVRAALLRRFQGTAPPRELLDRLVAGDVASVARQLAAGDEPGTAARLWDLAGLCVPDSGSGPALADERAALEATASDPAAHATLAALIGTRHAFAQRLATGCAATTLDRALLERRLATSAAHGDVASLERLAALDPQPLGRLMSAAVLGSPRAQFRLALENLPKQPDAARAWLESAAKGDADAEAYYGVCLLNGCFGTADAVAARAALESAARRGAPYALGLLASGANADELGRWSPADALVVPVPPREPDALGVEAPARYAWAALAEELASDGCFGFEFGTTAEALSVRAGLERTLRPAELSAARAAAAELAAGAAGAARHALGCD
ncbi:MAG TPA: hypothetical protein VN790_01870 [Steroidobacteraceae bacterium]|nr:hypothetical protein [Steroidobacteraceae bacterium]